jgi:hypothetical protein
LSKIVGPCCWWLTGLGVVKISPGAVPTAGRLRQSATGCRCGRVWKCQTRGTQLRTPDPAALAVTRRWTVRWLGSGGVSDPRTGVATPNLYVVEAAPRTRSAVVTRTCSPGANGRAGVNIAPTPARLLTSAPGCTPVRLPTTRNGRNRAADAPRKTIDVFGEAVVQPGPGKARTVDAVSGARVGAPAVATPACADPTGAPADTKPSTAAAATLSCMRFGRSRFLIATCQ